jgi:lysyl-tRNA synthetase class 2
VTDESRTRPPEEENDQIQARLDKRGRLEEEGVAVYPSGYPVTHSAREALSAFTDEGDPVRVAVAGRVVSKRKMGRSTFLHVQDRSDRLQVYLKKDVVGEEAYERIGLVDLGDFLGATGELFRTKTGEVTVQAAEWTFLGKAMRPLPEKWHGLADKEIRFRQRYLDLLVNEDSKRVFVARTRMITAMRRVLDERDFLEVETPVLQPIYGGASARPFRTTHNALGITFYLRIADELYLKRCLVGGLDRVYEFGKDFRNEGMDRTHQPEFTMLEVYQAYADYTAGMQLMEDLCRAGIEAATGGTTVDWKGETLDFGKPWRRVTYFGALEEAIGVDLSSLDEDLVRKTCENRLSELPPGNPSVAKLLDELFSECVQPKLVQPTFVIDHPKIMSPLAKGKPGAPHLVERYEPIVAGMEVGNGFSELNDPVEQRARFEEQLRLAARDEDTMVLDEPFLRAMEHGMPPASGLGVGIDRLAMIFTGTDQIREVILFPAMRPQAGDRAEVPAADETVPAEAGEPTAPRESA